MAKKEDISQINDLDNELDIFAHPIVITTEPQTTIILPVSAFFTKDSTLPVDLFGLPTPIQKGYPIETDFSLPSALIGQDIIDIKLLTGKREKAAKKALEDATVEMMELASGDCFYIPGNTASSKNSKEIGFYFQKNKVTGKNDKVNILVDSKVTQRYRKETRGYWLQNKVPFLNQTRHLPIPLSIEFTFIRDSMRIFDFINACQVLADTMKDNGYFPDDDSIHFHPVFNPVVYYHTKLAGVIFKVIA